MLTPPIAAKHPVTRSFHGRDFVDDYEWLRDKESPETIGYVEAENAYTEHATAHLAQLREDIFQEIKSRTKETDMSVPVRQGDYWYYSRIEEGKAYGRSCRLHVEHADTPDQWTPPEIGEANDHEQVLLDLDALAEGHEFLSVGASAVTASGRYLAFSLDTVGDERFQLAIKDLETGELLEDRLENVFYGATWAGEEYLFYQRVDDAWRPDSVWRHRVGTPAEDDVCVFRDADERFNVGVGSTRSERYLMIESASKVTTEVLVLDMATPEGEFEVLWPRTTGVEYAVDDVELAGEPHWIVTHNALGANFSVGYCRADTNLPALADLSELVAHRDDVRIEGVDTFARQMVLSFRRGGIGRLAIMRLDGGLGEFVDIDFPEELYTAGLGANPEWDQPVLRMGFTSQTQPPQVLSYDVATGEQTVLKEKEVLGGYDKRDYTSYRLWATASDGVKVPVSVLHRADLDMSTPHPVMLYGYGSYELSTEPGFNVSMLSLLDRGVVVVDAHVRGGGEMGRKWYEDGRQLSKKNTFTDFIAVADDLVARGMTSYDRIVAWGGSAGGMLMGAVANMAPEKFAGILAVVPFVDSLTSMLKPELPLTVIEWDEWGDPYHDSEVYDYMASYSAYENVEAKDYPNILAVTSLNDTRVLYVEPAKWIAKLRDTATGGQFLLKTEMSAGHGGVSGRYDQWRETAFKLAWLLDTIA
ncbi:S9 family peptidase [Corynebacterium uterequi]|uniref:Protease II n=1 Tax=Corynebacterium uterequi TaxID=1072256 RepID=A0A0G3HGE5_9CORY|nr:S9 family peptidase [Corynebacterium uterequi]AKK11820.1 protease II [Corynebacterium uterequi]